MQNSSVNHEKKCKDLWDFPPVPPEQFFSTMNHFAHSAQFLCLIHASVKLRIFDHLEDWRTEKEIESVIAYPHPVTDYFNALIKTGLVDYEDGKIRNTRVASTYLTSHSPFFQGAFLDKSIRHLRDLWLNLSEILEQGPRYYDEEKFFADLSLPSMAQNALCGRLQQVVRKISQIPSFMNMRKMIDLGGGHGLYAIALACKNPDLSAIIFDLPGVVSLAETYIAKYHLESRVQTRGGDFFTDPIGEQYDLILSSSNPSGKSPEMVMKIAHALNEGGYFVNIQPGDEHTPYDPLHELEFLLWTFDKTCIPKTEWSKTKKFPTEEYLTTLSEYHLQIQSISQVTDPYIKNYHVTMMIAQKKADGYIFRM